MSKLGLQFVSSGIRHVSKEVGANFAAWFRHNFVDQGSGRIGIRSYQRAGEMDDVCRGSNSRDRAIWYHDAYERGLLDRMQKPTFEEFGFILANPLIALQLALGITDMRGLRCYRRGLSHEINRLQQRSYRARYYARDNERRRRLAAERRKIRRRTTLAPCPTPEEFLAAWTIRNTSVETRIRLGGLVHDLECHVDNCLRFDSNGEVVGRNGGVKAWIATNLPQLIGKYKTIMRYKALVKRLRQAAEIPDPIPTAAIFDGLPTLSGLQRQRNEKWLQKRYGLNTCEEVEVSGGGALKPQDGGTVGNEIYYATKSHCWKEHVSSEEMMSRLEMAKKIVFGERGVFREESGGERVSGETDVCQALSSRRGEWSSSCSGQTPVYDAYPPSTEVDMSTNEHGDMTGQETFVRLWNRVECSLEGAEWKSP